MTYAAVIAHTDSPVPVVERLTSETLLPIINSGKMVGGFVTPDLESARAQIDRWNGVLRTDTLFVG